MTRADLLLPARAAMGRAVDNLARRQAPDGSWAGDHGGPMFLLPMYLALCHAAGQVPTARRGGMRSYLLGAQHEDGSVGLHAEDDRGSMFTTTLVYVGLRILGVPADDPHVARMRRWIRDNGTPLGAASWGKLALCLLGLYDWRGIHPILPELWLLPRQTPLHPSRLWCHARQVYLPMAWLYGHKATIPEDALVRALREELYDGAWAQIDWTRHRDTLSETDAYRSRRGALRTANRALGAFERVHPAFLRARAMDDVLDHIRYEDRVTGYLDIGPINKVLNTFVHAFREPGGEDFRRAFAACDDYLWDGHDGTKMQGYHTSKLWDTAFAVQGVLASKFVQRHAPMVESAYAFLRDNQILEDVPEAARYHRHAARGGWPFSSRAHGWPVTDCTSEALKCALALEGRFEPAIPEACLRDAVALILSWQNDDGGFATYERRRGGVWLKLLDASQVLGDVMVETSYVECTSACVQALVAARARFGSDFGSLLDNAVKRGARFVRSVQRADGSFEGSRAVCFTYGTWFGVSALMASGAPRTDPAVLRACAFLLEMQRGDGSFGEHGDSCRERRYVPALRGSVTQTAWALSTLVRAQHDSDAAQAKAARFLVDRQRPDGAWPREPPVGVFHRACLINYDNYRHYFPLWALAEWAGSATPNAKRR